MTACVAVLQGLYYCSDYAHYLCMPAQELDEAARRRMPKQLYIPLPCEEAREQMILRQLGPAGTVPSDLSAADLAKVVAKTAGYSGSDMRNLIQEACQVGTAGCHKRRVACLLAYYE